MEDVLNVIQYEEIDKILNNHEMDKHNLVGILLDVQALSPEHYISKGVAEYLSKKLNIFISNIYDVITFYSAFSLEPRGKHIIKICNNTCCKVTKYEKLKDMIENELKIKIGERTSDGMFSLEYSSCFGACDISPAIRIEEKVYGNLDEAKIKKIIESYRGK